MLRFRTVAVGFVLTLFALAHAECAELLDQVPRDALGFVVVRNLAETDAKAGLVLGAAGSRLPGPLALLKSIAGIQAGLDERRDMMVVLLPSAGDPISFSLALWLPVADYDALVHSLDGDPGRRVGAVTLAGEDLLITRHEDWAVIMDPDQRDRLEMLREAQASSPRQVRDWASWVAANDAAVVVLPSGMKLLLALAQREQLFEPLPSAAPAAPHDDLFGPTQPPPPIAGSWPAIRQSIRATIAERPELARWAAEAQGIACGLRLDQAGSAVIGAKLSFADGVLPKSADQSVAAEPAQVPQLFSSGEFVVVGGGQVSPRWVVPAVAPYVRQVASDLTNNYAIPVAEDDVARFRTAAERAVGKVRAFAVLTRPGSGNEAVFTNNFLALRVGQAQEFLDIAAECVEIWNEMLGKPDAAMKLVFKSREITVAERKGTEYSIDMAAAVGAPAIPEARASIEKLFGPGALFRLQMVSLDDETVLLAAATEEQVAEVALGMQKPMAAGQNEVELQQALRLLSPDRAWYVGVSPHGYTTWLKRQMDAVLGAVIGGPIVPQFPPAPPVAVAGSAEENAIWLEAAVPIETSRAAGQFWRQR